VTEPPAVAVIVDGYHAGSQFVSELRRRGIASIHVKTCVEPGGMFPPVPGDMYLAEIEHDGDVERTLNRLRPFAPGCVIPGTETGVELADRIGSALGLPGNGLDRSEARRNKFHMAAAVADRGLRVAHQVKCDDPESAVAWAREQSLQRTVVKPLHGAGTDSVFICSTESELRRRASAVLGTRHHLGLTNDAILVQEFVEGDEYVVNTVSCEGTHHISGVWLYHKLQLPGVTAIYDWDELLEPSDPIVGRVAAYALGVLDALEIRNGPAHTEIMVDANGPVLIECGARLDGLDYPPLTRRCMGVGQLEVACDAYTDRSAFLAGAPLYARKEHASNVLLITRSESAARSTTRLDQIRRLPSFVDLLLRVADGDPLPVTIDYQTAPAVVFLAHPDDTVIREDYRRIRELEGAGIFEPLEDRAGFTTDLRPE
jgi:biotin carboxylase